MVGEEAGFGVVVVVVASLFWQELLHCNRLNCRSHYKLHSEVVAFSKIMIHMVGNKLLMLSIYSIHICI